MAGDGDFREAMIETVVQTVAAVVTAAAVKALLDRAFSRRRGRPPPTDPTRENASRISAVAWSAMVGAAAGAAKLLVRRETTRRLDARRPLPGSSA
jgi:hypothetical protein